MVGGRIDIEEGFDWTCTGLQQLTWLLTRGRYS